MRYHRKAPKNTAMALRLKLSGEFLAAQSAACVQDQTARFCRHAGTETVAAGTNNTARLEWAFHSALRLLFKIGVYKLGFYTEGPPFCQPLPGGGVKIPVKPDPISANLKGTP